MVMKEITVKINHDTISYAKSGLRILGCVFGLFGGISLFFILMILAEGLGVYEELV